MSNKAMPAPERLYAIIGHPLGHSLSPLVHNRAFQDMDIPGVYMAFPTPPDRLPAVMDAVRALPVSGLSVTIPHKQAVMPHLDRITPQAKTVGAVNTIYWDDTGLVGHNTDMDGFIAPLAALPRKPSSALVLGAGGAARAVLAGLNDLGLGTVFITNRTAQKARDLAEEFHVRAIPWDDRVDSAPDLIVNTTPLGMKGRLEELSPWPQSACLSPNQVVYDIVYNPGETVFLKQAGQHACTTIGGAQMFVHQAALQFNLWTGQDLDVPATLRLVADALEH